MKRSRRTIEERRGENITDNVKQESPFRFHYYDRPTDCHHNITRGILFPSRKRETFPCGGRPKTTRVKSACRCALFAILYSVVVLSNTSFLQSSKSVATALAFKLPKPPRVVENLLNRGFGSMGDEEPIAPILQDWSLDKKQFEDGSTNYSIVGTVTGHPAIPDGDSMTTAPLEGENINTATEMLLTRGNKKAKPSFILKQQSSKYSKLITTVSGTKYLLMPSNIRISDAPLLSKGKDKKASNQLTKSLSYNDQVAYLEEQIEVVRLLAEQEDIRQQKRENAEVVRNAGVILATALTGASYYVGSTIDMAPSTIAVVVESDISRDPIVEISSTTPTDTDTGIPVTDTEKMIDESDPKPEEIDDVLLSQPTKAILPYLEERIRALEEELKQQQEQQLQLRRQQEQEQIERNINQRKYEEETIQINNEEKTTDGKPLQNDPFEKNGLPLDEVEEPLQNDPFEKNGLPLDEVEDRKGVFPFRTKTFKATDETKEDLPEIQQEDEIPSIENDLVDTSPGKDVGESRNEVIHAKTSNDKDASKPDSVEEGSNLAENSDHPMVEVERVKGGVREGITKGVEQSRTVSLGEEINGVINEGIESIRQANPRIDDTEVKGQNAVPEEDIHVSKTEVVEKEAKEEVKSMQTDIKKSNRERDGDSTDTSVASAKELDRERDGDMKATSAEESNRERDGDFTDTSVASVEESNEERDGDVEDTSVGSATTKNDSFLSEKKEQNPSKEDQLEKHSLRIGETEETQEKTTKLFNEIDESVQKASEKGLLAEMIPSKHSGAPTQDLNAMQSDASVSRGDENVMKTIRDRVNKVIAESNGDATVDESQGDREMGKDNESTSLQEDSSSPSRRFVNNGHEASESENEINEEKIDEQAVERDLELKTTLQEEVTKMLENVKNAMKQAESDDKKSTLVDEVEESEDEVSRDIPREEDKWTADSVSIEVESQLIPTAIRGDEKSAHPEGNNKLEGTFEESKEPVSSDGELPYQDSVDEDQRETTTMAEVKKVAEDFTSILQDTSKEIRKAVLGIGSSSTQFFEKSATDPDLEASETMKDISKLTSSTLSIFGVEGVGVLDQYFSDAMKSASDTVHFDETWKRVTKFDFISKLMENPTTAELLKAFSNDEKRKAEIVSAASIVTIFSITIASTLRSRLIATEERQYNENLDSYAGTFDGYFESQTQEQGNSGFNSNSNDKMDQNAGSPFPFASSNWDNPTMQDIGNQESQWSDWSSSTGNNSPQYELDDMKPLSKYSSMGFSSMKSNDSSNPNPPSFGEPKKLFFSESSQESRNIVPQNPSNITVPGQAVGSSTSFGSPKSNFSPFGGQSSSRNTEDNGSLNPNSSVESKGFPRNASSAFGTQKKEFTFGVTNGNNDAGKKVPSPFGTSKTRSSFDATSVSSKEQATLTKKSSSELGSPIAGGLTFSTPKKGNRAFGEPSGFSKGSTASKSDFSPFGGPSPFPKAGEKGEAQKTSTSPFSAPKKSLGTSGGPPGFSKGSTASKSDFSPFGGPSPFPKAGEKGEAQKTSTSPFSAPKKSLGTSGGPPGFSKGSTASKSDFSPFGGPSPFPKAGEKGEAQKTSTSPFSAPKKSLGTSGGPPGFSKGSTASKSDFSPFGGPSPFPKAGEEGEAQKTSTSPFSAPKKSLGTSGGPPGFSKGSTASKSDFSPFGGPSPFPKAGEKGEAQKTSTSPFSAPKKSLGTSGGPPGFSKGSTASKSDFSPFGGPSPFPKAGEKGEAQKTSTSPFSAPKKSLGTSGGPPGFSKGSTASKRDFSPFGGPSPFPKAGEKGEAQKTSTSPFSAPKKSLGTSGGPPGFSKGSTASKSDFSPFGGPLEARKSGNIPKSNSSLLEGPFSFPQVGNKSVAPKTGKINTPRFPGQNNGANKFGRSPGFSKGTNIPKTGSSPFGEPSTFSQLNNTNELPKTGLSSFSTPKKGAPTFVGQPGLSEGDNDVDTSSFSIQKNFSSSGGSIGFPQKKEGDPAKASFSSFGNLKSDSSFGRPSAFSRPKTNPPFGDPKVNSVSPFGENSPFPKTVDAETDSIYHNNLPNDNKSTDNPTTSTFSPFGTSSMYSDLDGSAANPDFTGIDPSSYSGSPQDQGLDWEGQYQNGGYITSDKMGGSLSIDDSNSSDFRIRPKQASKPQNDMYERMQIEQARRLEQYERRQRSSEGLSGLQQEPNEVMNSEREDEDWRRVLEERAEIEKERRTIEQERARLDEEKRSTEKRKQEEKQRREVNAKSILQDDPQALSLSDDLERERVRMEEIQRLAREQARFEIEARELGLSKEEKLAQEKERMDLLQQLAREQARFEYDRKHANDEANELKLRKQMPRDSSSAIGDNVQPSPFQTASMPSNEEKMEDQVRQFRTSANDKETLMGTKKTSIGRSSTFESGRISSNEEKARGERKRIEQLENLSSKQTLYKGSRPGTPKIRQSESNTNQKRYFTEDSNEQIIDVFAKDDGGDITTAMDATDANTSVEEEVEKMDQTRMINEVGRFTTQNDATDGENSEAERRRAEKRMQLEAQARLRSKQQSLRKEQLDDIKNGNTQRVTSEVSKKVALVENRVSKNPETKLPMRIKKPINKYSGKTRQQEEVAEAILKTDGAYVPSSKALVDTGLLLNEIRGLSLSSYKGSKEMIYKKSNVSVYVGRDLSVPVRIPTPGTFVEFSIAKKGSEFDFGVLAVPDKGYAVDVKKQAQFTSHAGKGKDVLRDTVLVGAASAPCTLQFKFVNKHSTLLDKVLVSYTIKVTSPSKEILSKARKLRTESCLEVIEDDIRGLKGDVRSATLSEQIAKLQQDIEEKEKAIKSVKDEEQRWIKLIAKMEASAV